MKAATTFIYFLIGANIFVVDWKKMLPGLKPTLHAVQLMRGHLAENKHLEVAGAHNSWDCGM